MIDLRYSSQPVAFEEHVKNNKASTAQSPDFDSFWIERKGSGGREIVNLRQYEEK